MSERGRFWKGKKVLVTGHEGFLGSWLVKKLLKYEARIIGVDKIKNRPLSVLTGLRARIKCIKADISDFGLIEAIVDKNRPDIIFHLAAEAIVGEANRDPVKAFESNIEGTWNILDISRRKKYIKAIVAASSDKAYGSCKTLPYTEDTPLRGSHPYDVSKSCSDLLCYTYYNTYNVPVCVTRCGNIYGPGDFNFSRIVPDAIISAIKYKRLIIRSDGKFTRDYVYVDDIADGYMLIAENLEKLNLAGEAFNLSNEKPVSVLALVKKIYSSAGKMPDYKILNEAKYEIRNQSLSAAKAKKILGWNARYSLDKGLAEAINWYRQNLGSI